MSRCSWSPFSFQGHLPRCQGGGGGDGLQEAGLECAGLEAPLTPREGGRKEVEKWEGASKDRLARMNQKRKKNTKIEDA